MKILFTGGGTGGHFYPIISIAQEIRQIAKENRLIDIDLYFMSPTPYDEGLLYESDIVYIQNSAGKIRRNVSSLNFIRNFFDLFRTGWGVLTSMWQIYKLYPDVIFGKGAYASFPALLAARIFRIPVVIHESDSAPGRVNAWAAKFAKRIAVSYPDCAAYFEARGLGAKVAVTGNPIRKELKIPLEHGAFEFLQLDATIPTILVLGGSQGAVAINDTLIDALPKLLQTHQVIHQTGRNNFTLVSEVANAVLLNHPYKNRYKPFAYLDLLAMRMSAGAARLVVSRAGSTIFEIASWGKPSIIIPIPVATSHDQTKNAFSYARTGAATVIEEKNLTATILTAEIERILTRPGVEQEMIAATHNFNHPDAAKAIATEVLNIALTHEI